MLLALGHIGNAEAGQARVQGAGRRRAWRENARPCLSALALAPAAFTPALARLSRLGARHELGRRLRARSRAGTTTWRRQRACAAALDRGRLSAKVGLSVLGKLGDARALSAALERLTRTRRRNARGGDGMPPKRCFLRKEADGRAVEPLAQAGVVGARGLAPRTAALGGVARADGLRARAAHRCCRCSRMPPTPRWPRVPRRALGTVPGKATALALLKALDADDGRVKRAAALSIRRSKSAELLLPLLTRLVQGGRNERALIYVALPGPLAQSRDDALIARTAQQLDATRGGERDELLEALSASTRPPARATLLRLAKSADFADRAKVAELLAASPDAATLLQLARDSDARVRENAVWSLGFVDATGADSARKALQQALQDRDAAVVGNAAISLGRLSRNRSQSPGDALCGQLLRDPRASVREQALRGSWRWRTPIAPMARQAARLGSDSRARVRRAAAEVLLRAATTPAAELQSLRRCQENDTHAMVAEACAGGPRPDGLAVEPTTVLIVPSAADEPAAGAPFELLWADGGLRLGSADRRGGVHEPRAPRGAVELLPYAGGD